MLNEKEKEYKLVNLQYFPTNRGYYNDFEIFEIYINRKDLFVCRFKILLDYCCKDTGIMIADVDHVYWYFYEPTLNRFIQYIPFDFSLKKGNTVKSMNNYSQNIRIPLKGPVETYLQDKFIFKGDTIFKFRLRNFGTVLKEVVFFIGRRNFFYGFYIGENASANDENESRLDHYGRVLFSKKDSISNDWNLKRSQLLDKL